MSKAIINIRNLEVRYDSVTAIEHANLDIYEDDFLGIIGPNGGGKSSLVKAIMGIIPYSGSIEYHPSICRKGKPHIGYLPQISSFDKAFPISVREVVLSGLQSEHSIFSPYSKQDKRRVDEVLEQASLADLARRPIGELSGGQLQRVMLCRAIVTQPQILVLDEPTNFVDNSFEREFYAMVQELSHNMAVVIVSHDLGTITSVVKSIVCVNRTAHRHDSNVLTEEQLRNYNCPIQIVSHGHIPHTVLEHHSGDGCKHHE